MDFLFFRLGGKTWVFIAEYKSKSLPEEDIRDRIWKALPENISVLVDDEMGSVLRILGLDTTRAY
ncbi:hypothetical protein FACS1894200_01380 [Spirochaetia bacterium]|nr:hypothetical protein FACS1894200_01380 [Spirochaetia bacterium]